MKSFAITEEGTAPTTIDITKPTPGRQQILVRVLASSVNSTDIGTAAGLTVAWGMPHTYPVTLGRDFAGTVEAIGDDVSGYAVGDNVFGELPFTPPLHAGTWAEYTLTSPDTLTHRPDNVDTATAGAAPLTGITALQILDALDITAGQTVLLVGATGGVGSIVSQLTAQAGAHVIAPALPEDEAFLHELGVATVIPRENIIDEVLALHPDGVDAIIDLVTYGTTGTYNKALRDGGRVVSATNAAGEGERRTDVNHVPGREVLSRLASHLSNGTIKVPISKTFTFQDLPEALSAFKTSHHHGKIALRSN
jgi:NADPH:quinone reductase-like Zn-dependent oxidoreductase